MRTRGWSIVGAAALLVWAGVASAQSTDVSGCCEVHLPKPFDGVAEVDLLKAVYPAYDPATKLLGPDVKSPEGEPLAGQLYDAAPWKGSSEEALLVMIESYVPENGERPEYGASMYWLDLAAFGLQAGKPVLLAKLRSASDHSGHSEADFDQAPYRMNPSTRAVGIRSQYMHMGHASERLQLFVAEAGAFRPVFDRSMQESSTDASGDELEKDLTPEQMKELYPDPDMLAMSSKAVLIVVEKPGMNDFKISEKITERQADGTLKHSNATEIWSYDAAKQAYAKQ